MTYLLSWCGSDNILVFLLILILHFHHLYLIIVLFLCLLCNKADIVQIPQTLFALKFQKSEVSVTLIRTVFEVLRLSMFPKTLVMMDSISNEVKSGIYKLWKFVSQLTLNKYTLTSNLTGATALIFVHWGVENVIKQWQTRFNVSSAQMVTLQPTRDVHRILCCHHTNWQM